MKILARSLPTLTVWPFEMDAAKEYGTLFATLKKSGQLVTQNDMQIAAVALSLNCVLVTKDSDFQVVSGLTVEDWSK